MAKKISRCKTHRKEGFTPEDFKDRWIQAVCWDRLFTEGMEKMTGRLNGCVCWFCSCEPTAKKQSGDGK